MKENNVASTEQEKNCVRLRISTVHLRLHGRVHWQKTSRGFGDVTNLCYSMLTRVTQDLLGKGKSNQLHLELASITAGLCGASAERKYRARSGNYRHFVTQKYSLRLFLRILSLLPRDFDLLNTYVINFLSYFIGVLYINLGFPY